MAGRRGPTPLGAGGSWPHAQWTWPQELKPLFAELLLALAILAHAAYLLDRPVYLIANDIKDAFHQFALSYLQMAACGGFRLDPAHLDGDAFEAALCAVQARCLEMGVSPSSNVVQRFVGEMGETLIRRFSEAEEPFLRADELAYPAFGQWCDTRRALGVCTGRNEARIAYRLSYTDDLVSGVIGAAATVRFLVAERPKETQVKRHRLRRVFKEPVCAGSTEMRVVGP